MYSDPTDILFYGDPHGVWTPLIEAVRDYRPLAVVILGDCELAQPLRAQLATVWDMVPCWKWIIGNHDVQTVAEYEFLVDGHPDGDLGSKIDMLGDLRVAGLGGVYRSQVWYPKSGCDLEPAPAVNGGGHGSADCASRPVSWWRTTLLPGDHLPGGPRDTPLDPGRPTGLSRGSELRSAWLSGNR